MRKIETKKLNRRQYIASFIYSYLSSFFFFFLGEILIGPSEVADVGDYRFYFRFAIALIMTLWLHWYSIVWLIKFIRNKEPMPE